MSLQACADLVARGDPDRFRAAMATPPEARAVLFPLYAFNLEVSRAPWVTEEPMIAEMRLQFWRDVAEEIGQGAPPRAHEVAAPLTGVVRAEDAGLLDGLVAARRWDIYRDAFEDAGHFERYLDATGGNLDWAAARTLGAPEGAEAAVRDAAWAAALARFLRRGAGTGGAGAHPAGRRAGGGGRGAGGGGAAAPCTRAQGAGHRSARAGYALYAGWQAEAVLRRAEADPVAVAEGRLGHGRGRGKLASGALALGGRW
jgi:phytoene synthase